MGWRWRQKLFWAWASLTIFTICYLLILAWREDRAVAGHALYKVRILRRLNSVAVVPYSKGTCSRQSNPLSWYLWNEPPICGNSINLLRSHAHFPLLPTLSGKISSFAVVNSHDDNYGQRIIGLLKPPLDGNYEFAIECTGSAELWLGENEKNAKRIANVGDDRDSRYHVWQRLLPWKTRLADCRPVSSDIHLLSSRKYYIEVLHVSGPKTAGFLKVGWRLSSREKSAFYVIAHPYICPYPGNISGSNSVQYDETIQGDTNQFVVRKPKYDLRSDFYKYKILDDFYISKAMPNCSYSPSHLVRGNVGYYDSVFHVREISIYPDDQTSLYNGKDLVRGNTLLDESVAMLIVRRFMKAINKNRPYSLILRDVVSIERSQDSRNGDRYFLNLLLQKSNRSLKYRVTTYVIQPVGQQSLCLPHGLRWRYKVHVTVIISVKNQGYWLKQFVDCMSRIYTVTKDSNFNVVIVDFNSTDVDINSLLTKSSLKRYKIIQMEGPFSRTLGLQMGANSVADRHSIILLMDLHLYIPNNFIDNVRRRTIEGRTAFVPYFLRLNCNYSPNRPNGFWEDQSYGIVGIYKSDFDRIGGMNTKVYKYKWGGEDWELLSRILSNGLEVERFRYPQFFHFFHRRRGSFYKGTLHDSKTLMYYLNIIWQKFIFRRYGKESYA